MTREEAIKQVKVALERLKSNFSKTAWWTGTGEAFETLIPELKPDDEATRNEILAYIGSKTDIDLETHNRWCSYLEKQKEQKPTAEKTRKPKFSVGDKIRYFGTEYEITGIEGVSDGYMYNVLDISPNPDNNSLYRVHSSREPRMEKIAEQKPEVKAGDDETEAQKEGDDRSFILDLLEEQLRYCKKNQEGARRSRRIHSAMDWIKSVDGKCDIEEDRKETEFDPQPGERFWVRCKTDKSENYWFDKGEERPAYAAPGKGAYRVCFDKDGGKDSPGIWYLDKEWLFHDFDIVDEVNDKPVEQWPNLSNCKHDCRTCFARCFYRKEQNPELWKRITGNELD